MGKWYIPRPKAHREYHLPRGFINDHFLPVALKNMFYSVYYGKLNLPFLGWWFSYLVRLFTKLLKNDVIVTFLSSVPTKGLVPSCPCMDTGTLGTREGAAYHTLPRPLSMTSFFFSNFNTYLFLPYLKPWK